MRNLNKKELLFLEKVFEREINGGILQSNSKIAKRLQAEGYIVETSLSFNDRLGSVVCNGYVTTILGNITYCSSDLCLKAEDIGR